MADDSGSLPAQDASALCDYLDDLVESLRTLVPAALKDFDSVSIHHARVATRRLKAAIDLLEPLLSEDHRKPFARAGRKLRRRLGPLRDLDVMIEHLQQIQKRAAHRTAAAWLEKRLTDARTEAREDSDSDESPAKVLARMGEWWGLREEVIEARGRVSTLLAQRLHMQLDSFAEQATRLCETGEQTDQQATGAVKQDPHEVRIAGKALRYTLEMAKCEGHPIPSGVAKSFKKMQDALGEWHDLVVLTERAMGESIESLLAHHDTQFQRKVIDLAKFTIDGARKAMDRFGALWRENGTELIQTIRTAVPLVAPVPEMATPETAAPETAAPELAAPELAENAVSFSESQTDPDPSGSDEPADPPPAPAGDPAAT
jgi:CHAD domain-containing protein